MVQRDKLPDFLTATAIFFLVWIVYSLTMSPGILFEDSGEFALSTFSLGVSHPPGYPLYNLVGRLFQCIPVDLPGFRANIMSGFLGALGIAVLYAAARGFGFPRIAAAVGALACAFSRTVWSQSVIDEVYTLNIVINAGLLWTLSAMLRGNRRGALFAAFLLGLTAANHYTTLAAFIPAAGVLFLAESRGGGAGRFISRLAVGSFTAISITLIFSLLPLRAAAGPLMNWKNPQTVQLFIEHIKRAQFGQWENQLSFHIPTLMKYVSSFVEKIPSEIFVLFLFLGLLGIALMLMEKWKKFILLLWLFFAQSVGILTYVRFHAEESMLSVVRVFYIGAYMVFAIFIAAGIDGLLRQIGARKVLKNAAGIVFIALLCAPVYANYSINDLSHADKVDKFGLDLFRYLRRDSVVYLSGTQFTAPAIYNRFIRNKRADLSLVDTSGNLLQDEIEKVAGDYKWINMDIVLDQVLTHYRGRRYQAMVSPHMYGGLDTELEMRGPFYYISNEKKCDLKDWDPDSMGLTPEYFKNRDFETRLLPSIVYARKAECRFLNRDYTGGIDYLKESVSFLESSSHVRLYAGRLIDRYSYEAPVMSILAMRYYDNALEICPTYTDAMIEKAQLLLESQKHIAPADRSYVAAKELFEKALAISPGNIQARLSLANIANLNGNFEKAEKIYLGLLDQYPDSVLVYNNLANLYVKMRKLELAEQMYEKAIELDATSNLTLLNVSSYYMQVGQMGYAVEYLEKLLESNPDSAYGHYNLGLAMYKVGNYNTAVEHFESALELAPGLTQAWENMFLLLLDLERYDEALELVDRMEESGNKIMKERVDALREQVKERRGDSPEIGE